LWSPHIFPCVHGKGKHRAFKFLGRGNDRRRPRINVDQAIGIVSIESSRTKFSIGGAQPVCRGSQIVGPIQMQRGDDLPNFTASTSILPNSSIDVCLTTALTIQSIQFERDCTTRHGSFDQPGAPISAIVPGSCSSREDRL